jgi:hypothetical protein
LALPRRHPLNLLHATVRRTPAIAETLDTPQLQRLGKAADQTRDDPHHIPQQSVVGRMINSCCWSRKLEIAASSGSSRTPCRINSTSAKLICRAAARAMAQLFLFLRASARSRFNALT